MNTDGHRWKEGIRKGVLCVSVCVFVYGTSYIPNSFFGGYWIIPEMDGRNRWSFGLAMMDAIMWQPRFGHEAIGHLDYLGVIYKLLIRLDRKYVHPTIHLYDDGFEKIVSGLKVSQVHPYWRDEFITKVTAVASRIESQEAIRCTLHYSGSDHPRTISEIRMPRGLAKVSELSPPASFIERDFEDYQKYEREHYIRWVGKLVLPIDQDVVLVIPAKSPQVGTGRIRFYYERDDATSNDQRNFCSAELK